MRKVILVTILSLAMFQMGCSSLKCGCSEEKASAAKTAQTPATTEHAKDSCGCEGCKHAGGESCGMKK